MARCDGDRAARSATDHRSVQGSRSRSIRLPNDANARMPIAVSSPPLPPAARLMAKVPAPLLPAIRRLARVRGPRPSYGPDRDLESPGTTSSSVIVACEARTGSELLCRALESTGVVGAPEESFNPDGISRAVTPLGVPVPTSGARVRRWVRRLALQPGWYVYDAFDPTTFAVYVDEATRRRTGPNGVFSAKVPWTSIHDVFGRYGFDVTTLPGPITWIHLTRRDLVAQAVSWARARQTGDWGRRPDGTSAPKPARYDDDLVLTCFETAGQAVDGWNAFFAAHGIDPIRVTYEDLATDYESTVRGLLDALGHHETPVPAPTVKRQADATNAEWATRFRATHPDLA
jgi:LPS sulfotransferase NodH